MAPHPRLSPSSNSSSFSSPCTTTTPQSSRSSSFSPSTATSTGSSTRRSSSQPPPRARSSVPFSWEAQPGVPKHSPNDPDKDTANSTSSRLQPPRPTLRPPPPVRSYSDTFPTLRRRGSVRSHQRKPGAGGDVYKSVKDHHPVFVRDPFAAALAECCSAAGNQPYDDYCEATAASAGGGGSCRWAPEYYYCSPPRRGLLKSGPGSSQRRAAEYYCSPRGVPSKSKVGIGSGGPVARHVLGSVFGLRSLGLYASCKSASAVADSVAYLPIRPATTAAGSARVRSAAFPTAKKTTPSSSSFSRIDSVGLSRRRHGGFERVVTKKR